MTSKVMKSNLKKILIILVIAMLAFSNIALASNLDPRSYNSQATDTSGKISGIAGPILGTLQGIGVAVALITLVILAIKYFTSSADSKGEVKKQLIAFSIGAVLIFGAIGIFNMVTSLMSSVEVL